MTAAPAVVRAAAREATATGTMTINITPIDDATVTAADLARTTEDRPVVISVLANDFDTDSLLTIAAVDGQPITVNGWITVAHGDVMLTPDNKLTFMPAPNFNGETSFTYTLNTGSTATVTVTVDPVEDPTVVAGDLHAVVAEGDIVTLTTTDLTATDPDVADEVARLHGNERIARGGDPERVGHGCVHAGRPCGRSRQIPA